jgi:hypothetical protein
VDEMGIRDMYTTFPAMVSFFEYLEPQNNKSLQVIPHQFNNRCQCDKCACNSNETWHEIFSEILLYNPYTKSVCRWEKLERSKHLVHCGKQFQQ